MPEYTTAFKARMVKKMVGPGGMSATALCKEIGFPSRRFRGGCGRRWALSLSAGRRVSSPWVRALRRKVASTLRVDAFDSPHALYQVRGFHSVDGHAYVQRLPHAICLVGDAVGVLADDELLVLLGQTRASSGVELKQA
ncbi:MAG: hypothetical protein R3B72_29655 [Polyangiaceae bacterium]